MTQSFHSGNSERDISFFCLAIMLETNEMHLMKSPGKQSKGQCLSSHRFLIGSLPESAAQQRWDLLKGTSHILLGGEIIFAAVMEEICQTERSLQSVSSHEVESLWSSGSYGSWRETITIESKFTGKTRMRSQDLWMNFSFISTTCDETFIHNGFHFDALYALVSSFRYLEEETTI